MKDDVIPAIEFLTDGRERAATGRSTIGGADFECPRLSFMLTRAELPIANTRVDRCYK